MVVRSPGRTAPLLTSCSARTFGTAGSRSRVATCTSPQNWRQWVRCPVQWHWNLCICSLAMPAKTCHQDIARFKPHKTKRSSSFYGESCAGCTSRVACIREYETGLILRHSETKCGLSLNLSLVHGSLR